MKSSLDKKVIAAFGVALGIVATLGVIQYKDARRLIQDNHWVAHTNQVLRELDATLNLLADAEMSARSYVATGRESYVDSWRQAAAAAQAHFRQLHSLMSYNSAQQRRLAQLEPLMTQGLGVLGQAVYLRRKNDTSSAREIIFTGVGRKVLDDIRALIGEMKTEEVGRLRERNEAAEASNRHTTSAILYGSFTALLLLALAGLLVLFDVSERNRAERELARERDLLHILMDNIPDFIYFKDRASRFTRINQAQAKALGVSRPEDAVGKTDFDFSTPEHAQETLADEQQILRTGRPLITKVEEASRPGGTSIWVSTTKMKVQDVQGNVIGTFGVSRDVTQSKLAQEASRLLTEVTAGASSAEDVYTAMSRSLETICKLKGWQVGQAWLLDDDGNVLVCAPDSYHGEFDCTAFRRASLEARFEKGVGLPGRVWESNAPAWIVDVTKDENFPRATFARELGLKSAFAFPIRYGQTVFGVFEFFASEIREPDRDFLEVVDRLRPRLGDVFGRKRAEAALRASEERFRAVAETANDAILSADQHGNIIHWNKGAERTFGYSAAEALGKPLTVIMPERFHAAHQLGLQRYLSTGVPHVIGRTVELTGRRKGGSEFPVELSLASWKTGQGTFFTGIIRDITERKRFEQTLQEQNVELEKANRAKDRFLASMSHELRTPLNAVMGFTGTLLMKLPGPLTDEQSKQLRTIQASAKHLLSLISDLLDLAKIESGNIALTLEPVVLQSVVEEVCATLCPLAEKKGLALNLTLPEDQLVINTDRRTISQILINLASNAIKFTDRGEVGIVLGREKDGGKSWTQFSVHDTGIGIRPEDQPKLFQPFTRVERDSQQHQEGTGLGLHLSQKLTELIGGQISFKSEYGKGSTFTFSLLEPLRGSG